MHSYLLYHTNKRTFNKTERQKKTKTDPRKYIFTQHIISLWNSLIRDTVEARTFAESDIYSNNVLIIS